MLVINLFNSFILGMRKPSPERLLPPHPSSKRTESCQWPCQAAMCNVAEAGELKRERSLALGKIDDLPAGNGAWNNSICQCRGLLAMCQEKESQGSF